MSSNLSTEINAYLLPGSEKLLREDDSLLRQIFFTILQKQDPKLANKVNVIYGLAKSWCDDGSVNDFEMLATAIAKLEPVDRVLAASAFSHTLNLHNLTEEVFSSLKEKAERMGETEHPLRATGRSFAALTHSNTVKPEEIYKALCEQSVELVFTAHPTQAMRRDLLHKYAQMQVQVERLHMTKLSSIEKMETIENLQCLIQTAWRTDEIHRRKPTPQDEMRAGLHAIQDVIFPTLPVFLRRLDASLKKIGQPRLPLNHALFSFGSWMGGDRDGNPNVTHETTRDVCVLGRLAGCDMYFKEIHKLMSSLSIWRATPKVRALAKELASRIGEVGDIKVAEERKRRNYPDFWNPIPAEEPYRVILSSLRDKLFKTRETLTYCTGHKSVSVKEMLEDDECIQSKEELLEPLMMMYNSLVEMGDEPIANGLLLDVIRQVHAFGMGLMKLDIRQEATRHTEVVNAITEYLGLGSYASWSEEERLDFLFKELQSKRPLFPPGVNLSPDAKEVIDTLRTLAELPEDSLGAYVISMAKSSSDVLAVVLLQRECGIKKLLRVAPLFETLDDLDNAPEAMDKLLSNSWYHKLIDGHQECMIGYSDSGKDAGRLAAAWALYKVQKKLVAISEHYGVQLTLFHGRGGTVGRGGGPAHMAIKSQPPGTIKGSMRVTIQGEIITHQFGENEVCFRTLDLYTSAVLEATKGVLEEPKEEWKDVLTEMSKVSCEAYRAIVFQNPDFIRYFQTNTPVQELGKLNIGSRPTSRKAGGGIETLRAIPWIFAWTQTRFLLPVWLGFKEAVNAVKEKGQMDLLREMYQNWPFLKVTLDMVEMVLEKADPRVVKLYDSRLVDEELHPLGADLRDRFAETKKLLAEVTGHGALGLGAKSANPVLSQKIHLRAPYVTPLNMMQVECIHELRRKAEIKANGANGTAPVQPRPLAGYEDLLQDPNPTDAIEDALIITIKGIAAGMQNTG
ncbi:hypothetical protein BSKO_05782 [Bryopsis sp. KO-2023]|nr:hypothetical protein BSKO_05782 [Bryopsis sp. KO-2023]